METSTTSNSRELSSTAQKKNRYFHPPDHHTLRGGLKRDCGKNEVHLILVANKLLNFHSCIPHDPFHQQLQLHTSSVNDNVDTQRPAGARCRHRQRSKLSKPKGRRIFRPVQNRCPEYRTMFFLDIHKKLKKYIQENYSAIYMCRFCFSVSSVSVETCACLLADSFDPRRRARQPASFSRVIICIAGT
jgi:hypothetical protein